MALTWMTGSILASGKQPLRPQHSMSMDIMRSGATLEYSPVAYEMSAMRRRATRKRHLRRRGGLRRKLNVFHRGSGPIAQDPSVPLLGCSHHPARAR